MLTKVADSRNLKRPRPVLMIPLRRCGSHALRLRLNMSPEFYAPYPLHICDILPLAGYYGDLKDDRSYFQLIIDVIGLQNVSMVKWPDIVFDPIEIFDAIKNQPRSIHRVVWELLFRAGRHRGAKVIMDKSLDSVYSASELMELLPDMLFLNVVRDPRAQVSSMNKAIIYDYDTLLNAQTWCKAFTEAKTLADKYPDRVLTIRYEDFINNQEAILRRICSFFDITFTPAMLRAADSAEAVTISKRSALWESNKFDPIPAQIDKFKKYLSMDEIAVIETLAGSFMEYYGYQKITPANATITGEQIKAAKVNSEFKKNKAWSDLRNTAYQDYYLRMARSEFLQRIRERLPPGNGKSNMKSTAA